MPIAARIRSHRHPVGLLAAATLAVVAACTPTTTSEPTGLSTHGPVAGPSPSAASTPAPSGPRGSISVLPCGQPTTGTLCLGASAGTLTISAAKGSVLALEIEVSNPGTTGSTPIAVLLYNLDAAALPFGQPNCTACSSTSSKSVLGLEWPALAAGERRTLTVDIPVTGAAGNTAFFAGLYAQPLADVMADEIANGIQAGQQTWKVALAIGAG